MSMLLTRFSFYLSLAGMIFAGLLVLRLSAQDPVPLPPYSPPTNPFQHSVAAAGIVEAQGENIELGVPVAALITGLYVRVWDKVEAGQPLLQLDDRELKASLIGQRARVIVAEATETRLRGMLTRLEHVTDSRAITREELETRRSDLLVATAELSATRAAVEQTETLLSRLVVRAPRAATVLQVNTRPGEFVTPGSQRAPLILGDLTYFQIRADIDEQVAPRVRRGMKAVGFLKGDTQKPLPLEFVRVEPFIIPKTSLTGSSVERVDTRVLQVIYRCPASTNTTLYVGQQLDLYLEE
jgi:multidrug efflux pump subunit AcrA (membrane-fusion protein)